VGARKQGTGTMHEEIDIGITESKKERFNKLTC